MIGLSTHTYHVYKIQMGGGISMLSTLFKQSASTFGIEVSKSIAMARLKVIPLKFHRKVDIDFKVKHLRIKTIETTFELRQVLALRHKVFKLEFSKKVLCIGNDWDPLDHDSDHLSIIDEKDPLKPKIIGVYRLLSSENTKKYYSEGEFDIRQFLGAGGTKLELSRACIDADYRNGLVIALLWKGIAEYSKKINASYLFGLSSLGTVCLEKIIALHRYFSEQSLINNEYNIKPKDEYKIPHFDQAYLASPVPLQKIDSQAIPPLLKSYINAGARICSQPVIDRDFGCSDWLTILNLRNLNERYEKKFM